VVIQARSSTQHILCAAAGKPLGPEAVHDTCDTVLAVDYTLGIPKRRRRQFGLPTLLEFQGGLFRVQ
jgi:hypothetical protein